MSIEIARRHQHQLMPTCYLMRAVSQARILVAEDDDLTRELLAKVLRREGYEVVEAGDGAEALEALEHDRSTSCSPTSRWRA